MQAAELRVLRHLHWLGVAHASLFCPALHCRHFLAMKDVKMLLAMVLLMCKLGTGTVDLLVEFL